MRPVTQAMSATKPAAAGVRFGQRATARTIR
jgi:hypothetical protein